LLWQGPHPAPHHSTVLRLRDVYKTNVFPTRFAPPDKASYRLRQKKKAGLLWKDTASRTLTTAMSFSLMLKAYSVRKNTGG
jgi:hypothetical protein